MILEFRHLSYSNRNKIWYLKTVEYDQYTEISVTNEKYFIECILKKPKNNNEAIFKLFGYGPEELKVKNVRIIYFYPIEAL